MDLSSPALVGDVVGFMDCARNFATDAAGREKLVAGGGHGGRALHEEQPDNPSFQVMDELVR
jgi:hypothetical protein